MQFAYCAALAAVSYTTSIANIVFDLMTQNFSSFLNWGWKSLKS